MKSFNDNAATESGRRVSDSPLSVIVTTRDELRDLVRDAVRENSLSRVATLEVMTLEQVAELLQCSKATVKKYAKTEDFPGVRLGDREWRFRRSAVLAWLDARRKETV